MSDTFTLFIDLNQAGLDLDPEELEAYSRRLAADLEDGLVDEAQLTRSADVPKGSKAGEAGFDLGILKAEVNLENTLAVLGWLRDRIAGKTLEIAYGDVKLKYQTPAQLEHQLKALKDIEQLTVRVVNSETKQD